jgi:hypothetical protein
MDPMLVKLNRKSGERAFTATATDLPINPAGLPAASRGARPSVAVLGHPGRVAGLAAHLPAGWTVRPVAGLADVTPDDLVLVTGAREHDIVAARAALPRRSRIVALVDEDAPAELVAAVLTAGADACVRGGMPAILASHLIACRRRQVADRWSGLRAAGIPA